MLQEKYMISKKEKKKFTRVELVGMSLGISLHQGVRKPHLGSVDGTIAGGFQDGEPIVISWVKDDALDGSLRITISYSDY
jgi:hypothetical protein